MSSENPNGNEGWKEWSKYVLMELERLNTCYLDLTKEITRLRDQVVALNVKAGTWGLVGGCVPVIILIAIRFLSSGD